MSVLRRTFSALLIIVGIIFAAIMVLPLDSAIAKMVAEQNGYKVSTSYVDSDYRFYFNGLSEDEKLAYAIILEELPDFPDSIIVPHLSDAELQNVFRALSYDNPTYFFISNKCALTSIGSINYFMPQYIMSKADYEQKMSEINTATEWILGAMPSGGSDYDKELYIHDTLVSKCSYAESGDNMIYTIYGSLVEGYANCEGYSRAAQYLFAKAGIKNHLATGIALNAQGENRGHMWNIAVIDEECYNVDITWDDYSLVDLVSNPDGAASHIYFNLPSEKMKNTHQIDEERMWACCNSDDQNYYMNSGLLYSACNDSTTNSIRQSILKALLAGNSSIEIAFDNEEAYNQSIDYYITHGRMHNILKAANSAAPRSNRVDPKKVQYTKDDEKLIIRFFFVK